MVILGMGDFDRYGYVGENVWGTLSDLDFTVTPDSGFRTITITGGIDATNQTLIDWLQANAVRQ